MWAGGYDIDLYQPTELLTLRAISLVLADVILFSD
jgi:hypothetical protein